MLARPNRLQWNGAPGHYEVYYLTLTDPGTGVGVWIRYTMLAPAGPTPVPTAALWFLAMDPRPGRRPVLGGKQTFPIGDLDATAEPFELRIGAASLTGASCAGALEDFAWDLHWRPAARGYEHVHPALRRARVAQTVLVLPQADVEIHGTIALGSETINLNGARGGQAHLWGSKHARRWAWLHCNDFTTEEGEPVAGTFVDGVSVLVGRFGRELGPSTPVVGRFEDEDFAATSPARVLANRSAFTLTSWRFEAVAGTRKLVGEVHAQPDQLAGVTYHDPDGELAYCYNGETASLRLELLHRSHRLGGWRGRRTLIAPGRAHFEYAQRTPVSGQELLTR